MQASQYSELMREGQRLCLWRSRAVEDEGNPEGWCAATLADNNDLVLWAEKGARSSLSSIPGGGSVVLATTRNDVTIGSGQRCAAGIP